MTGAIVRFSALGLDTPIAIDRDGAARAARRELSRGLYHPGLGDRVSGWVGQSLSWLGAQLSRLGGNGPASGWVGGLVLAVAMVVLALGIWRLGLPARQRRSRAAQVAAATPELDAAGHRAAALAAAAAGDRATAVRERFRALTRELEQRAVLDAVPGRTATEIASDAAAVVPALGPVLHPAAAALGAIVYGSGSAGPADLAAVAAADEAVQAVRFGAREPAVPAAAAA